MSDPTALPFSFPSVRGKKLTAAFDGGRLTSDGGVLLLAQAARRLRIAEKLAAVIPDRRDPSRVVHPLPEIVLARILAIACGYADADDLDHLRADPAFKLACGRLPESGVNLMSQPTVSRLENTPGLRDLIRLGRVLVDLYCASYAAPPSAVTLDIDDTCDVVHGHQQLSLFHAHHDERCFLPIHVYDTATSRPVAVILRPGKTPSGHEVRGHLRRLVRAIRRHWPDTAITIRGDSHYGRPEAMDWCEDHGVSYVFGLSGTKALAAKIEPTADHIRVVRAIGDKEAVRGFAEATHAAKSWRQKRRVAARIEATRLGLVLLEQPRQREGGPIFGAKQGRSRSRVICNTLGNQRFQSLKALLQREGEQLSRIGIVEAKGASAAACLVVAAGIGAGTAAAHMPMLHLRELG